MRVVIETPKWSFIKTEEVGGRFVRAFLSPIPTPFNYGYIKGTVGGDGSPLDIIVLGDRLDMGCEIDVDVIGRVMFIDNDVEDDKYIASLDGRRHSLGIMLFFWFYAFFKLFRNFLSSGRWSVNRYLGTVWFDEGVKEVEKLE